MTNMYGPYFIEPTQDEYVITHGRVHQAMQESYEEQRARLAMKSVQTIKEMKPPVMIFNSHGYAKPQYFRKVCGR